MARVAGGSSDVELVAWSCLAALLVVLIGLYGGWAREVRLRHRNKDQIFQLHRLLARAEAKLVEVDVGTPNPLTVRESQVLRLAREGLVNKQIAKELGVAFATAKNIMHNAIVKTGGRGRVEAIMIASRRGWLLVDASERDLKGKEAEDAPDS